MKKLIICKTLMFIVIMTYIFGFKFIFGNENILIAVMSITGLLMFMGQDLTGEPLKNTLVLILFYVMIGMGTFIASRNIWVAIPVNFIIIFVISYTFGHVLKGPMYIPFSFLYLFLVAYPVSIDQMPLRIVALIVGASSIMLPQFIINKNKVGISSKKIFESLFDTLLQKIDLIKESNSVDEVNIKINSMLKKLKNIIYDKKEKRFYISEEGRVSLDVLVSIEKLSILIEGYKDDKKNEILDEIKKFIEILKSKDNKETIISYMNELEVKYCDVTDKNAIEILTSMTIISLIIKNSNKNIKEEFKNIKRNLKNDVYGLKNIKFDSIRLTYSLCITVEVVIACFIMEYFHLDQGRWIMYTVLSLTSPLLEITKSKAKDRIIATIIGAIFISVTFVIFRSTLIRSLIIMGAGYANMYCETYRQKIITVTISAIGAASLVGGYVVGDNLIKATPIILSVERVIFILIGAIIAIFINTFLFEYDVKKANKYLAKISEALVEDLVQNLDIILEKHNTTDYMNNIYLLNSQIEQTIKMNEGLNFNKNEDEYKYEDEEYNKLCEIKQKIITNVYEFQNLMDSANFSENEINKIKKLIVKIKNKEISLQELLYDVENEYLSNESIENKMINNFIFNIKKNLVDMQQYYDRTTI
ncbi:FUSC family protein [Clostridium massiliamazoniense]|uniref:FUSC family protein n=1 Tax=Clostridium massiliamazoniense TaxID=1347366 RepID=UPI0006D81909|nr:FUSC family protein [Clostridium massiliamazoniense]